MIMKKLLYRMLAAVVLAGGLTGCKTKEPEAVKSVDLRFSVEDSYDLPATSAQPFTILVVSSDPWTIRSEHPTWCIISDEDGEATDAALVFLGQATPTAVKVQYYDNPDLDDREDVIEIKSDYWVGKRVKVSQKGIAYLTIPEEEQNIKVPKAAGTFSFHVNSNQNWTAKVTEGAEWLSISEGETGSLDGTVTVASQTNTEEQRYATVKVYDRHDVEMAAVRFTQDGLQLEPETFEMRAEWNQDVYELKVEANAKWTAVKKEGYEEDAWYTIQNPSNNGSATLRITLQPNQEGYIRESVIVLSNVTDSEEEFSVKKEIALRQAYELVPIRFTFNEDELAKWKATKDAELGYYYDPTFNGTGALLMSGTQLAKESDPPGLYVFHWSNISAAARVRLWYSIKIDSTEQEIKYNFEKGEAKAEGSSAFGSIPSKSVTYDTSAAWHEVGIGFSPADGGYIHASVYFDGVEFNSFDTSATLGSNFTWGHKIKLYIGVDHGTLNSDSAVCEWYEYTPLFSWGDEE